MIVDTGVAKLPEFDGIVSGDASTDQDHGTHVAGIVIYGSNMPQRTKVCSRVKIVSCKFYEKNDPEDVNIMRTAECFKRAQALHADYVNYSAGGSKWTEAERLAIRSFTGKVYVAAGNESSSLEKMPYYPASYGLDNIVVVSNYCSGERSPKSNWSETAVPYCGNDVLSWCASGETCRMTGTSQSTAGLLHDELLRRCGAFEQNNRLRLEK
jgi:hypothetical protein